VIRLPSRGTFLAVGTAVLMHALLFLTVLPSNGLIVGTARLPPATRYAASSAVAEADQNVVRITKSPVVFALPSASGFSQVLSDNDVQTRKTFMQPQVRSEHFLEVAPAALDVGDPFDPRELMISTGSREPQLPAVGPAVQKSIPPARRVTLSPQLKSRLVGGIVLPPELNRTVEKPWMVRATLGISEQGAVEQVLLDQPLETQALNQQVIRVLRGLRFKPGAAAYGSVEIYSPDASVEAGRTP